jgi:hypothetical protein
MFHAQPDGDVIFVRRKCRELRISYLRGVSTKKEV